MNSKENIRHKDKNKKRDKAGCKTKKKRRPFEYLFYDFVKITGAPLAYVCFRPKLIFEDKKATRAVRGKAVVAPNHVGMLDMIAVHAAFPARRLHFWIIKDAMRNRPGKWFFTHVKCISVDKNNFDARTVEQTLDVLSNDKAVCIFPEGTINTGENIVNDYKLGAAYVALRGGAPVIPLYIVPRKKWYSRMKVVVGAPIETPPATPSAEIKKRAAELTELMRERTLALAELYEKRKKHRDPEKSET